ncbi:phosphoethanolamine--lipid A transferase [Aliiglaciecola sp. LCG003]|uniref:phosphoethanolamine transferase n=1 Tax=Aliiglaciecola sp. LCG003 TaxID=3053655 RepID=UPI002573B21F|nr:phosphoethanolamine--lipid A transferase [Aliiglaciecola sp. LCG003]WJG09901.1 phosphoethanolamine--lipid A transferase [Aliiglaciecola sp. LCG003]
MLNRYLPKLSAQLLLFITALFISITGNLTFFAKTTEVYAWDLHSGFLISLFLVLFSIIGLLALLLDIILPTKIAIATLLIISALSGYFTDQFGIIIGSDMLRSMLETDSAEAFDLISWTFILQVSLFGVLPSVLIAMSSIRKQTFFSTLKFNLAAGLVLIGIVVASVFLFSDQYASFIREHKSLRFYTNPLHPVYSAVKITSQHMKSTAQSVYLKMTSRSSIPLTDLHRELVIVVVGETARADHFSLNGYGRQTNPNLAKESRLINYSQITACGTSTAVSVPCMFSMLPRDEFDIDDASNTENVLDILAKADISVLWRDNNSDSKGVADRVPYESYRDPEVNPVCDTECRDEGMLAGLQEYIDLQEHDILIVLHQMGSHGPAYYKRYPRQFEVFKPACQTNELSQCSDEEIVNAYDNTILYTDHFLSKVIGFLKKNTPRYETSMLYVSDHGESLGENNIYLHGLPYMLAPDSQLKVPVIAWVGESSDIDLAKSRELKDIPNSHDAISYAILSALEIESDVRPSTAPPLFILADED